MSSAAAPHPTALSTAGADVAWSAPLRFERYALHVRDLERMLAFYTRAVGLSVLDRASGAARLGNDGVVLLELMEQHQALPDDNRTAGLHHAAFLMPTRRDLADWHRYYLGQGFTLSRTGDHHVNEALYFDDPEGNGVECYADREPGHWRWDADGKVYIPATPVDLDHLDRDATPDADPASWSAPRGMRLGHINLRVGDLDAADRFYGDLLGLDHTCRRPQMTFLSAGRYHHHMAANNFTSAGAGARDPSRAGLAWFMFAVDGRFDDDAAESRLTAAGHDVDLQVGRFAVRDPWGTLIHVTATR